VVVGDIVRIKISLDGYAHGLKDCSRIYTAGLPYWSMIPLQLLRLSITPLGRFRYEFQFKSIEEMRKTLAQASSSFRSSRLFSEHGERSFFGYQGYLISFWLTKLFHDFWKKKIWIRRGPGVGYIRGRC